MARKLRTGDTISITIIRVVVHQDDDGTIYTQRTSDDGATVVPDDAVVTLVNKVRPTNPRANLVEVFNDGTTPDRLWDWNVTTTDYTSRTATPVTIGWNGLWSGTQTADPDKPVSSLYYARGEEIE